MVNFILFCTAVLLFFKVIVPLVGGFIFLALSIFTEWEKEKCEMGGKHSYKLQSTFSSGQNARFTCVRCNKDFVRDLNTKTVQR